jgi:hypothetical protein
LFHNYSLQIQNPENLLPPQPQSSKPKKETLVGNLAPQIPALYLSTSFFQLTGIREIASHALIYVEEKMLETILSLDVVGYRNYQLNLQNLRNQPRNS